MPDYVLVNGDIAAFIPMFSIATVVVRPGILQGSGPARWQGKPWCVEGDEKTLAVPGCPYSTPMYSIPGIGTLKIAALAPNQIAKSTTTGGKAVLLKGGVFTARFEVQTPAQQPVTSATDPMALYSGQGMFTTFNTLCRAT